MGYNPYIVVPLATWIVAQFLKFAIYALKGRVDLKNLYASGGMPSVHSAVVCSLATTAFLLDGGGSHLFGLTVIFAAVVMYDSFGVRRSTGEQAAAINMLVASLDRGKIRLDTPGLKLREILGHKPVEVIAGATLGVVLAALFNYDRITPLVNLLTAVPAGLELWIYTGIFAALVLVALVARLWFGRKYRSSPTVRRLIGRIFTAALTMGLIGLAIVAFEFERVSYLAWRLWAIAALAGTAVWAGYLVKWATSSVPVELAVEAERARKRKWLTWGRKAKRSS